MYENNKKNKSVKQKSERSAKLRKKLIHEWIRRIPLWIHGNHKAVNREIWSIQANLRFSFQELKWRQVYRRWRNREEEIAQEIYWPTVHIHSFEELSDRFGRHEYKICGHLSS